MYALCSSLSTQCKISHHQNPQSFLSRSPSASIPFANYSKPASSSILFTKPAFSLVPKVSESESAVIEAEFDEKAPEAAPVVEAPKEKREDIFAVVVIGSRQYIVIPGRHLTVQRLKGANVDDKIVLNKVLLVGSKTRTYIGKPIVTNAVVHAIVEDQGLDPKVRVFKYKKKKNYRRNIGHRQPNTRIRIVGISGYQDFPYATLQSKSSENAAA